MPSPKNIKNPRLIKIMRELKNLEDAIEETEIIIECTKRKLTAIEKEKIKQMN